MTLRDNPPPVLTLCFMFFVACLFACLLVCLCFCVFACLFVWLLVCFVLCSRAPNARHCSLHVHVS